MRYDTINFLTDYGLVDEFVGVVKSVMYSIAPDVRIVDVTHDVAAHDIRGGGLALARAAAYLNPGVVVAVVDPGVGGLRKGVAVEVGDGSSILVGPDNGLLAPAVALVGGATAAVDITRSPFRLEAPGPTFDGRDLFGPVAAHLCAGASLADVGTPIDPALLMPAVIPVSSRRGDTIIAEVLWVDHFGNAQLNLDPDDLEATSYSLQAGEVRRPARRVSHFEALGSGELGLVVDSTGMVAVVLNRMSAAAELGLRSGTEVHLLPGRSGPDVSVAVTLGRPR
jgi:S-adenosyl-L-methionine hydrolase (adenosine-forming)